MDDRYLRRACEAAFQALLRPTGRDTGLALSAEAVCQLVAMRRGTQIRLYPASLGGHPYGLVLRLPTVDIILYERHTTAWHQQHIILHEAAHILYDHKGGEAGATAALKCLVPDLPNEVIS